MWAIAGSPIEYPISFFAEDDYVVPSAASMVVRDIQGAVILAPTPLDVSTTSTIALIPAALTEIPAGQEYQTLFLSVTFTADGRLHQQRHTIQITPFIPLTAGPEDVRQTLGLRKNELEDHEVRLLPAFFRLKRRLPDLESFLLRSSSDGLLANRAVVLEAALELMPSLALRVSQKVKAEDQEVSRFQQSNWQQIAQLLEAELDEIVEQFLPPITSRVNILVKSFPPDPITGG